ncbi:hypothetical protein [Sorangium sp. So ce1000]|uniref:hypothetical protein n=1 Tax=Sorangium sp. So ce1000 TaxID=3133325 RepID=UPI003F622019
MTALTADNPIGVVALTSLRGGRARRGGRGERAYGSDRAAALRRNDALGSRCSGSRASLFRRELGVRAPLEELVAVDEGIGAPLVRRRFTITSPREAAGQTRVISRMATSGRIHNF